MNNGKEKTIEETENEFYPLLVRRYQSALIDQIFIMFILFFISQLLGDANDQNLGVIKGYILFGIYFNYEPVCNVLGCSAGNYVCRLRVRKFGNEKKRINILQAYIRYVVKILLGVISFFTVTSNKHKRAIHDMAAGSVVVVANRS